jgi:exodeoxyribonuclease VII large subunit
LISDFTLTDDTKLFPNTHLKPNIFWLTGLYGEGMLTSVNQFSFFNQEQMIWTVTELNRHIRQVLESDYRLQDLWVSGEISNLSRPSSGHMYFTLKDQSGSLRCVMWRPDVANLFYLPKDGEAIEVHGYVSVYEAGGQYQLYADWIRPAGEGALYRQFLRLKESLEAEGLFELERKRSLPVRPSRIGVVTSPSAAAFRDVINVLRRRYPMVEVILSPTPVQGVEAPPKIVAAIEILNEYVKPDVILMVRGGGSMEDLWAFNDEAVVRAVAASKVPIVSGIGHETDLILTDFAADVRAPTPSAAAEVATPDRVELLLDLKDIRQHLIRIFSDEVRDLRWELSNYQSALLRVSPYSQVINAKQQADDLFQRAVSAIHHYLALQRAAITGLTQTLRVVAPTAVLARGYAWVRKEEDGSIVRSVTQVQSGDALKVQVSDGEFKAHANEGSEK